MERKDAETKGVCDLLLEPDILLTSLLLVNILAPMNNFSKLL